MASAEPLVDELNGHLDGTVNARTILNTLQKLSVLDLTGVKDHLVSILHRLWNHDLLLDDCILVSGIIFVRLQGKGDFKEILNYSAYSEFKHADWVFVGIIRGVILASKGTSEMLALTEAEICAAIQKNRLILVARHLENFIQILEAKYAAGEAPAEVSSLILAILSKTLLLKSDLVEYKSRDLIKLQYQKLASDEGEHFLLNVLECMPETSKVAVQCFDAALDSEHVSEQLSTLIFNRSLPLIKVKGLSQTASKCVAKSLEKSGVSEAMLSLLFDELKSLSSTKERIVFTKSLLAHFSPKTLALFRSKIESAYPQSSFADLISLITGSTHDIELLSRMLQYADEQISFEAFSCLVGEQKRKPVNAISSADLQLFKSFLQATAFSGSLEFRQKVLATSKSFYEQVFGRIYHLIREQNKNRTADQLALSEELDGLFNWILDLFLSVFIEPFDFVSSNCGGLEFSLRQIMSLLLSFEGNSTLAGANKQFMVMAQQMLHERVVNRAIIPNASKFINCVGFNTYDSLRLLSIEILCKSRLPSEAIDLSTFLPLLTHPRAINNEGAARMIQLHAKLNSSNAVYTLHAQLKEMFACLKQGFPASLMQNNVNGRMLALKLMLADKLSLDSSLILEIIETAIDVGSFVSGVASHPSPEGLDLEDQIDAVEMEDETISSTDASPSSQYVLSFAWRAIKESSALLETLASSYASSIKKETLTRIGRHFIKLLLTLRHRGAFSSVEGPLTTVLRLSYTFPEIKGVLAEILIVALETEAISCTRRSAGLPHLILAIVHACSKSCELDELLNLLIPSLARASSTANHTEASTIHAFNITRSLVRDSKLAPELGRYLGVVAQMCLETFNSDNWSIRNASSMLLSSIIARVFGTTHMNESATDQIDVRELEVKFDGLLPIIESFISNSLHIGVLESRLAYPILAILERIKIPAHERFNPLRGIITAFLIKLLQQESNGNKVVFVISRVLVSLLLTNSIEMQGLIQSLNSVSLQSANVVYNLAVILEALNGAELVEKEDLKKFIVRAESFIKPEWNESVRAKLLQSHNSGHQQKCSLEIETPVESYTFVQSQLDAQFVYFRGLESSLQSIRSVDGAEHENILFRVLERFKLNESIIEPVLILLCEHQKDSMDSRLISLLNFYAPFELNENVRFICVEGVRALRKSLLFQIPQVIFNLLLDDCEEIRQEMCQILNTDDSRPQNLFNSVKKYVGLVGKEAFSSFLTSRSTSATAPDSISTVLFEREALNAFIDPKWLSYNFL